MATVHAGRNELCARDDVKPGNRLLIVSNRGPLEHTPDEAGRPVPRHTDGGVATALSSIAESTDVDWIACAATEDDAVMARRGQRVRFGKGSRVTYVAPPAEAYDLFYNTFCNPVLWFLQHGIWDQLEMANPAAKALHSWQLGYLPVNQSVAEIVAQALRGRADRVMFHDYHFYMAPLFVRNYHPAAWLQHFIHVPWPDPGEWTRLPRKIVESICRGLLANDSVVFQTAGSVDNFLATCDEMLENVRIDFTDGIVETRERQVRVWANPISVDAVDLHRRLLSPEAKVLSAQLSRELGEQTIIRVDRLDPSKNVLRGFEAFEALLERQPQWRGRVRFLAFLVPTREAVQEYSAYAQHVFATVDRINRRFGEPGRRPVKVFHEHNRLQALAAMRLYDVLLVNSAADGMNLVSKEGAVLNERDGVLVLSRTAGSYGQLGHASLGIDPKDTLATAEALHSALSMPSQERQRRARLLRGAVLEHQLSEWLAQQLDDLSIAPSVPLVRVPVHGPFAARKTLVG